MRLYVFLIMAVLLMAASCQKSATGIDPVTPTLQDRLVGTWKYTKGIEFLDYGPTNPLKITYPDSTLTQTFTKDGKLIFYGYWFKGDGKTTTATCSVDSTAQQIVNGNLVRSGRVNYQFNGSSFSQDFFLNPSNDTLTYVSEFIRSIYVRTR